MCQQRRDHMYIRSSIECMIIKNTRKRWKDREKRLIITNQGLLCQKPTLKEVVNSEKDKSKRWKR